MSFFLRRSAPADVPQAPSKVIDDDDSSTIEPASTKDIITFPSASCKLPEPATFTSEQQHVIDRVKEHMSALHSDLAQKDAEYVPWERRWIQDPCTSRRYAKAANWDEQNALKRVTDTLLWRREYKPDLITPDSVKREGETGKHILSGFDNHGRPCLYLRPGRENTAPNPQQIRFLVYDLERAIDFCPPNQDKICLVIDFYQATKASQPSFSTQLKVLHILQNHYPERLGSAIVVNVPWFFTTLYAAMQPFMDPVTREKIRLLRSAERVKESIPVDMLDHAFGGSWKFDFDFEHYWNQINEFCGIAQDGTRSHESKARAKSCTTIDNKEAEAAATAAATATTATTTPANGNGQADVAAQPVFQQDVNADQAGN